ncbi:MAG: hypothetical protein RQ754_14465 [Desulfuromonadales bacterium]|nr:hypothetical protein [Desulfuromonadales bacterium]
MRKNRTYRRCLYLLLAAMLVLMFGCGGGGGGSSKTLDVAGVWTIVETSGENTCDEPVGVMETYDITVVQDGTDLTVTTPMGVFSGSIAGDVVEWTGSFAEDGGTTTITLMDLLVSEDGKSISGTADWTWTNGAFTCEGSMSVTATKKTTPDPPPSGLDLSGFWSVVETTGANDCGDEVGVSFNYFAEITQDGNDLDIYISPDMFSGTLDGDVISWTGSYFEDGGTTTITSMSLTVDESGDSFSGNYNWVWTLDSFSCSGVCSIAASR